MYNNSFLNNGYFIIRKAFSRKLGNVYLSPYRTLDFDQSDFTSGTIK